ncbi:hypothetical protein [Pedobacter sp. KBW01]|uniref:hypothetical protein n=1 Tax=Pedobacter sp. KBW01 TaxID=2153364 RepID=UPI001319E7CB|nr:hypothetical protein [Pedobacter sp. KBW01]
MMNLLSINYLKMSDLGMMIVDKKRDDLKIIPLSTPTTECLEHFCVFLQLLKPIVEDLKMKGFI